MLCPRRVEVGPSPVFKLPEEDVWSQHHTCSYCGSYDADKLMERIEAGTVVIVPTDKSYKAYLRPTSGAESFHAAGKFYFQHMSTEQMKRFVELLNEKRVKFGDPGFFYVKPFFIA